MSIISYLFPRWKVTKTKLVEVEMQSGLGHREWTEQRVLEIQTSVDGRKRAFWVKENRKKPVSYSYISAILGGDV